MSKASLKQLSSAGGRLVPRSSGWCHRGGIQSKLTLALIPEQTFSARDLISLDMSAVSQVNPQINKVSSALMRP